MIPIPPQFYLFAFKYGQKILIGFVAILLIIGGYYFWKHKVVSEALEKQQIKYDKRDADFIAEKKKMLAERESQVNEINDKNRERYENAIEIYAKHYDNLRNAAANAPKRLYIHTKTADTSCDAMPGTNKNRSETGGGAGLAGKTELPEKNLQRLNTTIAMIEAMQLRCERLLNTVSGE